MALCSASESGGYRYVNETSFGTAGVAYLIRGHDVPLSLFARGDFGDKDFDSITGGLKLYPIRKSR